MRSYFMYLTLAFAAVYFPSITYAQAWSSWTSIQTNGNSAVQYCYRLNAVSSGNNFSMKIKNNSLAIVCGGFEVNLNMINGTKKFPYSFNDLKPGIEKSCPGVYQFSDVRSFSSVTNVEINDCGVKASNATKPKASFSVDYHNEASRGGTLKFVDPKGQYSFEAKASSGHLKAANDPYTQQYKKSPDGPEYRKGKLMEGYGTIPAGTWHITGIKDKAQMILTLTPSSDVVNPVYRNGFLIHGLTTTAEDASFGCIILAPEYRRKLMKVFLRDGEIELKIGNKVY